MNTTPSRPAFDARNRAKLNPLCAMVMAILLGAADCRDEASPNPPAPTTPRPFQMALTTFAPARGQAPRDQTWDFVLENTDLIGLHYDDVGLPWESLDEGRIPAEFRERFEPDARDSEGRAVYVAITPLDESRSKVVGDFSGGELPPALGPALFSNPRLRQAFVRYAEFIQEMFRPRYMAVGIEANLYELRNPADFDNFVTLYRETYDALKAADPNLSIFPTLQHEFLIASNQFHLLDVFEPRLDRIGLSTYPSSADYEPSNLPADYFGRLRSFSARPIVITETGYGSRSFDNDEFKAPGSNELQRDYLIWLLDQAEAQRMSFLVWFFPTDIPDVVAELPDSSGLIFFGYMGITGAGFQEKVISELWRQHLARPYAP